MTIEVNRVGISIIEWGTCLYRIKRGPLPVDCIGKYIEATVPPTVEVDFPDESANLILDDVYRWLNKLDKKKIVLQPNPLDDWY